MKTEIVKVDEAETAALEGRRDELVERVRQMPVDSHKRAEEAAVVLAALKSMKDEAEAIFGEPKRKAKEAHQSIVDAHKKVYAPIEEAMSILKSKVAKWHDKIAAIAREKARKAAEAARKADEERRAALVAEMQEKGLDDIAEEVMAAPPAPPPPFSGPKKIKGVTPRTLWSAEEVDVLVFLVHAMANPDPWLDYVKIDMTKMNALARQEKARFSVPGFRIKKTTSVAV